MSTIEIGSELALPPSAEFDKPVDHCGVWAIWDPANPALLDHAFIGLSSIQHRGEGGAGVATISPSYNEIQCVRGSGKVKEVFGENGAGMYLLPADSTAAIGHTRWPTDAAAGDCNQPRQESELALGHNGQITNKEELSEMFDVSGYSSDTDLVAKIMNKRVMELGGDVERAAMQIAPELRGSFCITILTADKLLAFRDRNGIRPLQLGSTETGGYIIASENMAIDKVPGATWQREVEPAEMIVIDNKGLRSGKWAEADQATCMLEYVYLANKDTMLNGVRVGTARRGFGSETAKHIPPELLARLAALIPLPNGANQATHGMAEATGIPFTPLMKLNPAIEYGRSFIQADQAAQSGMAGDKLVIDPSLINTVQGKTVAVVDDSLVRSTTMKANIPKIREATDPGEVHIIIPAPKYVGICDLGVDTPNLDDLIAYRTNGDEKVMAEELGVESIIFATREDMHRVVGKKVCDSCLGGSRPNIFGAAPEPKASLRKHAGQLVLTDITA